MDKAKKYSNLSGVSDLDEAQRKIGDPTFPSVTLGSYVEERLLELQQSEQENDAEAMSRKVVSVRLAVDDIYILDEISKRLQHSRSRTATDILEIGIEELRAKFGIPRLFSVAMEGDGISVTLKNANTGQVLGTFEDDAIQIGGQDK